MDDVAGGRVAFMVAIMMMLVHMMVAPVLTKVVVWRLMRVAMTKTGMLALLLVVPTMMMVAMAVLLMAVMAVVIGVGEGIDGCAVPLRVVVLARLVM